MLAEFSEEAMFILGSCFGFSKNACKAYRKVADVQKGVGSHSCFVQQLE